MGGHNQAQVEDKPANNKKDKQNPGWGNLEENLLMHPHMQSSKDVWMRYFRISELEVQGVPHVSTKHHPNIPRLATSNEANKAEARVVLV